MEGGFGFALLGSGDGPPVSIVMHLRGARRYPLEI